MNTRTYLAGAAVATAAALFSACGGDSASSSSEQASAPPAHDFGAQATAACEDTQEQQNAIFGELFSAGEPTLDDWERAIPEYAPLMEECAERIAKLRPPSDLADEHEEFLAAMRDFIRLQHDALGAAKAGDEATFMQVQEEAQGPVKERLSSAAESLGFGEMFE